MHEKSQKEKLENHAQQDEDNEQITLRIFPIKAKTF